MTVARKLITLLVSLVLWMLLAWPHAGAAWNLHLVIMGVVASVLVAALFPETITGTPAKLLNPVRYFWLILYIFVFVYYCIVANLQVMYLVLHPELPIRPGVVKVKTRLRSRAARTVLANSITLTPGTMSVDVTDDGYLYIHWLTVQSTQMRAATHEIVDHFEGWIERIME